MTLTDKQVTQIEADLADDPAYWEAVRQENEALLASVNPRTRTARIARQNLAEYEAWREQWAERERQKYIPKHWKWATWRRLSDGTYAISAPKGTRVGDSVRTQMKDGTHRLYRLTEGGDGLWTGYLRLDQEAAS
jgi:hypothetical protein